MVHTGLANPLRAGDQALLLLDCPLASDKRRQMETFSDPHDFIHASLCAEAETVGKPSDSPASSGSFSVASRLISHNFEERARNDALVQALQALRQRRPQLAGSNGRIIR